ncbi:hypothetical protein VAPA_1c20000 [Variovorax paradoxus B4]|uniref:Aspartate carbamoyltransferase n=1 Tax=Variovorax paradoxus B4 TaxID=1246301 RepID=T1X9X6_VARPD|nr:hypothetical protein [Variovorax paradoxus]AGU49104.1 hypothetical protein VAPA_1c20000 [Variovorax paradoxus B4]
MHQLVAAAAAALIGVSVTSAAEPAVTTSRQEDVAHKGASVMPFDLARTTHFFDDTPDGGVETITANDPKDVRQTALIRSHLAIEARRFARGDFSDPARIHGQDMAGLTDLAHAGDRLRVSYANVPAGARLTFASDDPAVVTAIHTWFAAQRSDHGAHMHLHHK